MPKYLLDTNACIAIRESLRNGSSKNNERREAMQRLVARWQQMDASDLAMSFVTLGELMVWAEKHSQAEKARALLQRLGRAVALLGAPQGGGAGSTELLAARYAEVRSTLERQGQAIGGNDLWIAAHALAAGLTVVTGNTSEFNRVPGLTVEDWTA